MTSNRWLVLGGIAALLLGACGGGVSLGSTDQNLGKDDGGGGGGGKDCTAKDACGPALGAPAQLCADGSLGGNTGRCLANGSGGCGWEFRDCTADAGSTTDGGSTTLHWYMTCGSPVCMAPPDGGTDAGTVVCAPLGTSCTTKGATCGDPAANCGAVEVCDDHDPKAGPGGCPISTKKAKQDITYVSDADLTRLHDETIRMKLATYRYTGPFVDPNDPNATHLGFIVEDQPRSLSVDRGHDRVDLYGYMSMAVATMQVQERQLAALRKQVDALEASCPKKAPAAR